MKSIVPALLRSGTGDVTPCLIKRCHDVSGTSIMPSPLNCEQYAAIAKPVLDLRKFLTLPDQSAPTVQTCFLEVKQVYQTTILRLDLESLDAQSRSIVTEINRLMRLLETQLMFLKSARTEAAIALRQRQILEHLNQFTQLLAQFDPAQS